MKLLNYSSVVFFSIASIAMAQSTVTLKTDTSSADLAAFRKKVEAANPGMTVVSVEGDRTAVLAPVQNPKIAIFVKNQTRVPGMDDMVDGIRDRIGAEMAGSGMVVLDQSDIISAFRRYKITTDEERSGLIDGLFTGGTVTRVSQMLGADFIMNASVISANKASMKVGGKSITTFAVRMTSKVLDASTGASVYGKAWTRKMPVTAEFASGTDDIFMYNDLLDVWASETGAELSVKAVDWNASKVVAVPITVSVSTTIDSLIDGLESGVRAPNDLLDSMRRLVGGATIEVDGVTIGSAPGTFQVAPGLHQLRISRQWMKDWNQVVNFQNGGSFKVALELSDAGLARYQTLEKFRASVALDYATALSQKNIKINFDTAAWRDVSVGGSNLDVNISE